MGWLVFSSKKSETLIKIQYTLIKTPIPGIPPWDASIWLCHDSQVADCSNTILDASRNVFYIDEQHPNEQTLK